MITYTLFYLKDEKYTKLWRIIYCYFIACKKNLIT